MVESANPKCWAEQNGLSAIWTRGTVLLMQEKDTVAQRSAALLCPKAEREERPVQLQVEDGKKRHR